MSPLGGAFFADSKSRLMIDLSPLTLILSALRGEENEIPTGLRPPAQGCRAGEATLGKHVDEPVNPNGVVSPCSVRIFSNRKNTSLPLSGSKPNSLEISKTRLITDFVLSS
jgi:hypothetical protein